jgi:hypothetical protein
MRWPFTFLSAPQCRAPWGPADEDRTGTMPTPPLRAGLTFGAVLRTFSLGPPMSGPVSQCHAGPAAKNIRG